MDLGFNLVMQALELDGAASFFIRGAVDVQSVLDWHSEVIAEMCFVS